MLSSKHQKIFEYLINLCFDNENYKNPVHKSMHAACLFSGNKILSSGCNREDRSCIFGGIMSSEHAELVALHSYFGKKTKHFPRLMSGKKYKTAIKQSKNINMMVIRITKDGCIKNSKCCAVCNTVMLAYGIKSVWYTAAEDVIIKEKILDITPGYISSGFKNYRQTLNPDNIFFGIIANHRS